MLKATRSAIRTFLKICGKILQISLDWDTMQKVSSDPSNLGGSQETFCLYYLFLGGSEEKIRLKRSYAACSVG